MRGPALPAPSCHSRQVDGHCGWSVLLLDEVADQFEKVRASLIVDAKAPATRSTTWIVTSERELP